MELFLPYLPNALLIFCRITSFFVVAPVFSSRNVPAPFKIGLAFFVTWILFAAVGMNEQPVTMDSLYALTVIREILVGLLLGFLAYLFFTAVQVAGSFTDMQMGFGMANVIDPMTGTSTPLLGNLKYMVATLLFLTFNGHHHLLQAIMDSYQWIPLQNELFTKLYSGEISEFLLQSFTKMFSLAFQLAAPLVVSLFLADVGLGILAKTAPQFNVFVIGLPLKILIGFLILLLMIPSYGPFFRDLFAKMFEALLHMLQMVAG